ncbi:hypothetical protein [Streptomyces inhibens]|uniref:hypothetical protein n=1 Tax=Streptomyces inhibens TaxID=2293571 RepID=UPI001EE7199E|nr:hypothetical protein [Streptomyces inhibens]UKY49542.1 hypothetical protein KI385_12505 [Streptomyces inhibens]
MTLANCPVTDEVIAQLVELTHLACDDTPSDARDHAHHEHRAHTPAAGLSDGPIESVDSLDGIEAFDAFLTTHGWRYSEFDDSYETAAGQVIWSGHYDGDPGPSGQTTWATFSVYDPEYDGVSDADHLAAVWGRARGWTLHPDQGRSRLDADWQAAAALLTARFGPPSAMTSRPDPADGTPDADLHFALWRGGDRLLCLAQDADPVCYSCFLRNVLVVVPADRDTALPGPETLSEWYAAKLRGEGVAA